MSYSDISTYVDEGKTAAEIAAILLADPRTKTAIQISDLMFLLNNRTMLVRLIRPADSGEKWSGSVVEMLKGLELAATNPLASEETQQLNAAAQQWFSHITNERNDIFDTTDIQFATLFAAIRTSVADQNNMPTTEDFEAILALGGGLKFADVTEQDVEALIFDKWVADTQSKAINASAQMQSQIEQLPSQADEATLVSMWAAAWEAN